jgi:hypothetical protein
MPFLACILIGQQIQRDSGKTMEKGFWLKWTVVNAVSFAIATLITTQLTQIGSSENSFEPSAFGFFGGAAALTGLITGAAQEVMLRKIIGGRYGSWTLATILGGSIGWFLGAAGAAILTVAFSRFQLFSATPWIGLVLLGVPFGLGIGLGIGICQRFVLRRVFANASPWIAMSSLARALAWLVGVGIMVAASSFLKSNQIFSGAPDFSEQLMWAIAGLIGGAIYGLITGGAFHTILRRKHKTAETSAS